MSLVLHRTVEARKLEQDRPPSPNQRYEDNQHESSCMHVPFSGSTAMLYKISKKGKVRFRMKSL